MLGIMQPPSLVPYTAEVQVDGYTVNLTFNATVTSSGVVAATTLHVNSLDLIPASSSQNANVLSIVSPERISNTDEVFWSFSSQDGTIRYGDFTLRSQFAVAVVNASGYTNPLSAAVSYVDIWTEASYNTQVSVGYVEARIAQDKNERASVSHVIAEVVRDVATYAGVGFADITVLDDEAHVAAASFSVVSVARREAINACVSEALANVVHKDALRCAVGHAQLYVLRELV